VCYCVTDCATVCAQRVWRGYLARALAVDIRAEMSRFIGLMRAEEGEHDEEEYWKTHGAARLHRGAREFFNDTFVAKKQYAAAAGGGAGAGLDSDSEGGDGEDEGEGEEEF
jgi:hypothetical protein